MTLNITSLSQKHSGDRQSSLQSGDTVYLYGDRNYRGKLIHLITLSNFVLRDEFSNDLRAACP